MELVYVAFDYITLKCYRQNFKQQQRNFLHGMYASLILHFPTEVLEHASSATVQLACYARSAKTVDDTFLLCNLPDYS